MKTTAKLFCTLLALMTLTACGTEITSTEPPPISNDADISGNERESSAETFSFEAVNEEDSTTAEVIELSPSEGWLYVGYSFKLEPTVTPVNENTVFSFVSSDETVATVSEDGTMLGVSAGTATISVTTENGASVDYALYVRNKPVSSSGGGNSNEGQSNSTTPNTSAPTSPSAPTAPAQPAPPPFTPVERGDETGGGDYGGF